MDAKYTVQQARPLPNYYLPTALAMSAMLTGVAAGLQLLFPETVFTGLD